MNDYEFAKLISMVISQAEKLSRKKKYILKPQTILRLNNILSSINVEYKINFDHLFNAIDIKLMSYVFDSKTDGIQSILSNADVFVIDAENDGKVCIEIRLLDIANEIEV